MGVPHGISRPRKGNARGCAQASVPRQCATAPLRSAALLSLTRERRGRIARHVWAPRRPRHVRARARQCERRAGGVVSSSPTVCQVAQLAHMGRRPRPRVDPPAAAAASAAVGRAPYERGARWEGNRLHKQSKRVASRRPRRSLPCTGHVSCCGSETPRAGPWVVGAVAVPQKQAVGGRGGAHWSSGRPHVRARTAQGERGVMGRTARIVREGGRTE